MIKKRGHRASISGKIGEDQVEALLYSQGFEIVHAREYMQGRISFDSAIAYRQFPVPHPYMKKESRDGRNDFLLRVGLRC